jgi:phosphoribosylglycinamide formyltransferase 1
VESVKQPQEKVMRVGLITYDFPHLKTEQVMQRLLGKREFNYEMYALPFKDRKAREVLFSHRPDQKEAVAPSVLAARHDIPYMTVQSDREIESGCELYVVLGAGILSPECVEGKRIINCHPGVIPASRGLDSFKWALLEMKPLGITLHYIDAQVDAGEIISIVPTNVYTTDTPATLARRHYENEIDLMGRFYEFVQNPSNPFEGIAVGEARMRMPLETEKQMLAKFGEYTARFGK